MATKAELEEQIESLTGSTQQFQQAITEAGPPLTVSVVISRINGKMDITTNARTEEELRLMTKAIDGAREGMSDAITQMVERRIREELTSVNGSESP